MPVHDALDRNIGKQKEHLDGLVAENAAGGLNPLAV
jgi:hypothetical protein